MDADPTARVKKARIGADVERDRVLSEGELILLFQKLPKAGLAATSQLALLIQLATAARIGEVLDVPIPRVRDRIALAADRTYLKSREAVLKFLYERHRFVEAAE